MANELKQSGENIMDELEAILDGCKINDRASQKKLYDRFFEALYVHGQSYRLNDQDRISLINQTMLKVFQNIESYQGEGALESWIHTIHKNNILNYFRNNNRQKTQLVYDSNTVSWWGAQNGNQNDEMDMEYIHLAMQSLPEQTREVLDLYAIQGYKHKEIAQMLDMSVSNSKYHLGKARELMAEKLKNNHGR